MSQGKGSLREDWDSRSQKEDETDCHGACSRRLDIEIHRLREVPNSDSVNAEKN